MAENGISLNLEINNQFKNNGLAVNVMKIKFHRDRVSPTKRRVWRFFCRLALPLAVELT